MSFAPYLLVCACTQECTIPKSRDLLQGFHCIKMSSLHCNRILTHNVKNMSKFVRKQANNVGCSCAVQKRIGAQRKSTSFALSE
jgi:hypothetical protein